MIKCSSFLAVTRFALEAFNKKKKNDIVGTLVCYKSCEIQTFLTLSFKKC